MTAPVIIASHLTATGANAIALQLDSDAYVIDSRLDGEIADLLVTLGTAYVEGNIYDTATTTGSGAIEPMPGDRAAFDAADFSTRHANDIDTAPGIHHTLGTDADQAAAGNHAHSLVPGDIPLTEAHILVGDASDVAADVAMSQDATIDSAGAVTVVGLQTRNVDSAAPGDGDVLTWNDGASQWEPAAPSGGPGGGHVIQDNGSDMAAQPNLNFTGPGVTLDNDIANSATKITISGGTIGGSTGAADNAVLRADGVGGATLQDSLATIDDSGGINIPAGQTYNIDGSPHTHSLVSSQFLFYEPGILLARGGAFRIYNNLGRTVTISKVMIAANTAPTGAAIIVDIHLDGTTIFTNQAHRPQIAATANTGDTTTIDVAAVDDGHYLTMDIDQAGSTIAGADLTVHVVYS